VRSKIPHQFWTIFRWVLAIALVVYAVRSGRLDVSELKALWKSPVALAGVWSMMVLGLGLTFWRWKILLSGVGLTTPFSQVVRLGMIGQFFSVVIPGAVSGDLVKAVAISKRHPGAKLRAVSSILLDRVLGMGALIVLAAVGFWVAGGPNLSVSDKARVTFSTLGYIVSGLSLVGLSGLLVGPFLVSRLGPWIDRRTQSILFLNEIYKAIESYKSNWSSVWFCFGISILNQALNVGVLYFIGVLSFGDPLANMDAGIFVLATLLGQSVLALPIAPMGVGVGQVAYSTLFQMAGASSLSFGSTLVTGWQALALSLNATGLVFFLLNRKESSQTVAVSMRQS